MKVRWSVTADRLRKATRILHAISRRVGDKDQKIRDAVVESLRGGFVEHFKPAGSIEGAVEKLGVSPDEPLASFAGVYAMILSDAEIDVSDQRLQETIFALVDRTIQECTDADPDGGPA